jgi:hypothetical protein
MAPTTTGADVGRFDQGRASQRDLCRAVGAIGLTRSRPLTVLGTQRLCLPCGSLRRSIWRGWLPRSPRQVPNNPVWEPKWDGYLAVSSAGRLYSRNGTNLTPLFPDLAPVLAARLPADWSSTASCRVRRRLPELLTTHRLASENLRH